MRAVYKNACAGIGLMIFLVCNLMPALPLLHFRNDDGVAGNIFWQIFRIFCRFVPHNFPQLDARRNNNLSIRPITFYTIANFMGLPLPLEKI